MNVFASNLFWNPTPSVADQRLTVDATVGGVQFAAFADNTEIVSFQVQDANVYCTLDGSAPTTSNGFLLLQNREYNWRKGMAKAAKFIRASSTSAAIHAQECVI